MESTNVHGGEPGARTDDAADPGRKAGWFFALFVATIVSTSVLLYVGVATHANHPPASLLEAIEQIAIVVMLCLTWFVGLDAARATPSESSEPGPRWRKWLQHCMTWLGKPSWRLYLVMAAPALLFAFAMHRNYNPAVFAMALAAIFVAAEHFSSIGEAKKGLDKTQGRLKETGDRLEQALVKSQTSIDTLLNADGIGKWRRHVYRAYRDAKERIDAVIREFDIDDLWWELDGNWNEYFAAPLDEAKGPTLYQALVGTGSKNNAKGADKVHFVGDIEVRTPGIEHGYPAFGNLLGLTWWLVVIHESMETRRNGDGLTGSDETSSLYALRAALRGCMPSVTASTRSSSAKSRTRLPSDC